MGKNNRQQSSQGNEIKSISANEVSEYLNGGHAYIGMVSRAPDGKDYLIIMDNQNHVVEAGQYDGNFSKIPVAILNDANAAFITINPSNPGEIQGFRIAGDQQAIFREAGFGTNGDYVLSQQDRAIACREALELIEQSTLKDKEMLSNCMNHAIELMYQSRESSGNSAEEIASANGPNSFRYQMKQYVIEQYLERVDERLATERIVAASGYSNEMEKAIAKNNIDIIESGTRYYETAQTLMSSNKFAAQLERDHITELVGDKDQISYDAIHHAMKQNQERLSDMVYTGANARAIEEQREYTEHLTNLYLQHPQHLNIASNSIMKNAYMHMPPDQTIYPSAAQHLGARTIDRSELFRDAAITYGGRSLPESMQYFQEKSEVVRWIYTSTENREKISEAYNNENLHNPEDRLNAVRELIVRECGFSQSSPVQDFLHSDDFTKIINNYGYLSTPIAAYEQNDNDQLRGLRPSESIDMSQYNIHKYEDCLKLQQAIESAIQKEREQPGGTISADLIILKQTVDDYITYNKAAVLAECRHVQLQGLDFPDGKYSSTTSAVLNDPSGKMRGFVEDLQRYNPEIDFKNNPSMHQMYANYVGMSNITAIGQAGLIEDVYTRLSQHPKIQPIEGQEMPSPSKFLASIREINAAENETDRARAVLAAFNLEPTGFKLDERTVRIINATVTDTVIDDFKEQGTIKRNDSFKSLVSSLGKDIREQDVSVLRGCDHLYHRESYGAFLSTLDKSEEMLIRKTAIDAAEKKAGENGKELTDDQKKAIGDAAVVEPMKQCQRDFKVAQMLDFATAMTTTKTVKDKDGNKQVIPVLNPTKEDAQEVIRNHRLRNLIIDTVDGQLQNTEQKMAMFNKLLNEETLDVVSGPNTEERARVMAEALGLTGENGAVRLKYGRAVDPNDSEAVAKEEARITAMESKVITMLQGSEFDKEFRRMVQEIQTNKEDVAKTDYVMRVERSDAVEMYSRLVNHANEFDFKLDWSRIGDRGYLEYLSSTLGPEHAKLKEDVVAIMDSSSSAVVQTAIRKIEVAVHQSNLNVALENTDGNNSNDKKSENAAIEQLREQAYAIAHREAMKYDPATASRREDLYRSQIDAAIDGTTMSAYARAQLDNTISKSEKAVTEIAESMLVSAKAVNPQEAVQTAIGVRDGKVIDAQDIVRLSEAVRDPAKLDQLIQERGNAIKNSEHYADYRKINDFAGKKQELHDIDVRIEQLKDRLASAQAFADEYTEKTSNKLKNAIYNYNGSAAKFTEEAERIRTEIRELEAQRAKVENSLQESMGAVDKRIKKSLEAYSDSRNNNELSAKEKFEITEKFVTDVLRVHGGEKYKTQDLTDGQQIALLKEKLEKLDTLQVPLSIRGDVYQARVDLIAQSRELASSEIHSICDRALDDLKARFDPNMTTSTFNADVIQEAMQKIEAEKKAAESRQDREAINDCTARLAQHQQILDAYQSIMSVQNGTNKDNVITMSSELIETLNKHHLLDRANETLQLSQNVARIEVLGQHATQQLNGWNEWVANRNTYEHLIQLQSDLGQMSQQQCERIAQRLLDKNNVQQLSPQNLIEALQDPNGTKYTNNLSDYERESFLNAYRAIYENTEMQANINNFVDFVNKGQIPDFNTEANMRALMAMEDLNHLSMQLDQQSRNVLAEIALHQAGIKEPSQELIKAYSDAFITSPMERIDSKQMENVYNAMIQGQFQVEGQDQVLRCDPAKVYVDVVMNDYGRLPNESKQGETLSSIEYFNNEVSNLVSGQAVSENANPNLVAIHFASNLENISLGTNATHLDELKDREVQLNPSGIILDKQFESAFHQLIERCDMTVEIDGVKQPSAAAEDILRHLQSFEEHCDDIDGGTISKESVQSMIKEVKEMSHIIDNADENENKNEDGYEV